MPDWDPMGCSRPGFPVHHPTPRACSNSCLSSRWCHPTISSSVIPFSCLQSLPASGSFPMSQFFASGGPSIGVSISPSNEYSGLISLRIDWFDLLTVQGTQEFSPTPQFKSYTTLEARNKLPYVSYVLYLDLSIIAIILTNTTCCYYFFYESSSARKKFSVNLWSGRLRTSC